QNSHHPDAGLAASNENSVRIGAAIGLISQLDDRGIHIKEGQEVENYRGIHHQLVRMLGAFVMLRQDQDYRRERGLNEHRDIWCAPARMQHAEEGRQIAVDSYGEWYA